MTAQLLSLLLMCIAATTSAAVVNPQKLIFVKPNTSYTYEYDGEVHMKKTGVFHTKVELTLDLIEELVNGFHCLVTVNKYHVLLKREGNGEVVDPDVGSNTDLDGWFSILISPHGEIHTVFYPDDEDHEVVNMKKTLVGLLSAKLHTTPMTAKAGRHWSYQVNESIHEGNTTFMYEAKPTDKGIHFTRKLDHWNDLPLVDRGHTKEILYDEHVQMPDSIKVKEHMLDDPQGRENFKKRSKRSIPEKGEHHKDEEGEAEEEFTGNPFPDTTSSGHVKLTGTRHQRKQSKEDMPDNLVEDDLTLREIQDPPVPVHKVMDDIKGNVSCIRDHRRERYFDVNESPLALNCFKHLRLMLSKLSDEDLEYFADTYIKQEFQNDDEEHDNYNMMHVLGTLATPASQLILTKKILLSKSPDERLISDALLHFISLDEAPPQLFLETLTGIAMEEKLKFDDEYQTFRVTNRAILVLAAVAHTYLSLNDATGLQIVRRIEKELENRDPDFYHNHNPVLPEMEYRFKTLRVAVKIASLGNSRSDTSFPLLAKYLRNAKYPHRLRRAALAAVSRYTHRDAAKLLFERAMVDPNKAIRRVALREYANHQHGSKQERKTEHRNTTGMARPKRGLGSQVLALPDLNWELPVGDFLFGANINVEAINPFSFDIESLMSSIGIELDIMSKIEGLIGWMDIVDEFLNIETGITGLIDFEGINILQDSVYWLQEKLAEAYDFIVEGVITNIKEPLEAFIDDFLSGAENAMAAVEELVAGLQDMLDDVLGLRDTARQAVEDILGDISGLTEMLENLESTVEQISGMLNDVKTDVTDFFNDLVDSIEVQLPWSIEQIQGAMETAQDTLEQLFDSPNVAISNLRKVMERAEDAMATIQNVMDKVENVTKLKDGELPYFFDLEGLVETYVGDLTGIQGTIQEAKDKLNETASNIAVKIFTGMEEIDVKNSLLDKVNDTIEMLIPQLDRLKNFTLPFQDAYDKMVGLMEDMSIGFEDVKRGFDESRTKINELFGSKMAKEFPRDFADGSCGDGFFPSTTVDNPEGIDLEIAVGSEIVTPFDGTAYTTNVNEITIIIGNSSVSNEVQDIKVLLWPMTLVDGKEGYPVFKGEVLGTVQGSGCSPNIIHVAILSLSGDKVYDPTYFLEKKECKAGWEEDDNTMSTSLMGMLSDFGDFAGPPELVDTSPERSVSARLKAEYLEAHSARGLGAKRHAVRRRSVPKVNMESLNIPVADELGPDPNFQVQNILLSDVYQYLEDNGMDEEKANLEKMVQDLKIAKDSFKCVRPESLDNVQLRMDLENRNLSTAGTRDDLLARFMAPDSSCPLTNTSLGATVFCRFHNDCLGMHCCADLQFLTHFHHSLQVSLRYDPCGETVTVKSGEHVHSLDISYPEAAYEDTMDVPFSDDILGDLSSVLTYQLERTNDRIRMKIEARICSTLVDECLPSTPVLHHMVRTVVGCSVTSNVDSIGDIDFNVEELSESTSLGDFESLLDMYDLDESVVSDLMADIVDLNLEDALDAIDVDVSDLDIDEFARETELLTLSPSIRLPLIGSFKLYERKLKPIPLWIFQIQFGFASYGDKLLEANITISLDGMTCEAETGPVGDVSYVEAYANFGLRKFYIRTSLLGYFLNIEETTDSNNDAQHEPMQTLQDVSYTLVALRIEFHVYIILEIVSTPKREVTIILLDIFLPGWSWELSTEIGPGNGRLELLPDVSAPVFEQDADSGGCKISQIEDRDVTDPAFQLEAAAHDEDSPVRLTYCIGTYSGGCDVAEGRNLGQQGTTVTETLSSGVPLYFTVTAKNDGEEGHSMQCELSTFDTTVPNGRVTPDFRTTSHPYILRASSVITEDSLLVLQMEAVGYGSEKFGCQMVNWTEFQFEDGSEMTDLPPEQESIQYFAAPQSGRLDAKPFKSSIEKYDYKCSYKCLEYPAAKCLSFNYDYGDGGHCELLEHIQGDGRNIHQSGHFKHYERLGVGYTTEHRHEDLSLRHNDLYIFNIYSQNVLGYKSIVSSDGVLADFTPPDTGTIMNAEYDDTHNEKCTDFVDEKWHDRCNEDTPLPNHRYVVDGPGSATVFNGHEPLVDLLYTRAYTYISANWDGYKDDQTGIYGYTWSVGNSTCMEDVHPHIDPHAHIYHESEWIHEGVATITLEDGHYHITVRALNKVEFGGPMATTVCHTTLYTIDTTPPFVHEVYDWVYDDETCSLSVNYNASDPLSYIREVDIGYGLSTRDVYVMDWQRHEASTNVTHEFCIPDGVLTWVRLKAWNNVDLYETGHAEIPVVVDTSPPIAGDLFDGPVHGIDIAFQNTKHEICGNWEGFIDVESGIEKYMWGVGTVPYSDDVSPFQEYHPQASTACNKSVSLEHNTTYYTTLTAYNAGHKLLTTTVSSNGVLYDETPPVKGYVLDGLDPDNDMLFSSEASSVSANWHGFEDPESDIEEYAVKIWRKRGHNSTTWEVLQDTVTLASDSNSFNWNHFHHHQGDIVYTDIQAINRATSSTADSTDGFLVDLSAPIMHFLGDGMTAGVDDQYTASSSILHANWDFEDPESSVGRYELAVYEKYGGATKRIYPKSSNEWEIVDGDESGWTSPSLSLKTGGKYTIRVSSINNAGLTNVQDTDGVTVDPSSPKMKSLAIGSMASDMEELYDGYVQQTDEFGITAYWYAVDYESGIKTYHASVGTSPGGSDICDNRDMGPSAGGYIDGLHLEFYDEEENGPIYYVTVTAENGARTLSEQMVSSPIKVVPGDQIGVVIDGAEPALSVNDTLTGDVDFQKDATVVTAHFSGFESHMHGIMHYEWAIGKSSRGDDVQPFIRAGIVVGPTEDNPGGGIAGSGKCQSLLELENGVTYYVTVRAITGAGNVLESISDGFTVDTTRPQVDILSVGVAIEGNATCSSMGDVCYQESSDTITAEWTIKESDSDILFSEFCFGSYPGSSDVYNCTDTTERSNVPNAMVTPDDMGQSNILFLRTLNGAGLWGQSVSGTIIVDTTPAIAGAVKCPLYVGDTEVVSCTWSDFYDSESGVSQYRFGIGTEEGDDSLYRFVDLPAHYHDFTARGFDTRLNHSSTYYVTVIAVNGVGYESSAYSEAVTVDTTPPVPNTVIELDGIDRLNLTADFSSKTYSCETSEECERNNAVCQTSLTSVTVSWQPFQDPESPMKRYQIALGTTQGGTQLVDFKDVDDGETTIQVTGLDLASMRQVFAMVRGFNQVGLSATASSDGVFISRVSSGLPTLGEIYVWDGTVDGDIDYQEDGNAVSGHWNFDGDPCPIVTFEWSVMRFDGAEILPMTEVPAGRTSATADGVGMSDGESYYIVVRATNALGYTYSLRSNGVTIMMEPLKPGSVRDGNVMGRDFTYQPSVTTLSANWDGFGEHGTHSDLEENEEIHHYEVAAGTDPRYPSTRDDVHPFTDVGLNHTHTFWGLRLLPQSVTYYMTVRAYAVSSTMTEVTSNGIQVGYGGGVLSPGEVSVDRYSSSATNVTASWNEFEFTFPILFYQWGIMSAGNDLEGFTCRDLQNANDEVQEYFDIYPLTHVADNTMVVQGGLQMEHGHEYIVVVVANDESATCAVANSSTTVDLTPPDEGRFVIGPFYDERVAYVPKPDTFTVEWLDFEDEDSGISHFSIALLEGENCKSKEQPTTLLEFEDVPSFSNEFTYNDMELQVDKPYFVQLKTTNNAGLTSTSNSMPILVDPYDPGVGIVKDGQNFLEDVAYQSDNSTMEGVFIHLPLNGGEVCPSLLYDFKDGPDGDWHYIHSEGVWGLQREHRILFEEQQLHFYGNGLSVKMERDVQSELMLSGAYYTKVPEVSVGGTYEFEIQAASSQLQAVTSVVFWDGPEGVVGDFNAIMYDVNLDETECSCCYDVDRDTSGCLDVCDCSNVGTTPQAPESDPQPVIVEDELEGETGDYDGKAVASVHTSIGIQINPGVEYNGTVRSFVALWGRFEDDKFAPVYAIKEVDFNPDIQLHNYVLNIVPDKEHLKVQLSIDGEAFLELYGLPTLSATTTMTLAVWNRDDYVPSYDDVFDPPSTEALFALVRMPPAVEELCRYGDPFLNGLSPTVSFYATVASHTNGANIVPLTEVARPCVACEGACSRFNCDTSCPAVTSEYKIKIDGLNLSEWTVSNGTKSAASYYVKVIAFSASGRTAEAHSSGIILDTAPPVFETLYTIDKSWSDQQPIEHQGSDSTIAAMWTGYDIGTSIKEYRWAIGTTHGGTDIQDFVSVGNATQANNDQLSGVLQNRHMYYITVKAIDQANLETDNTTGVEVVLDSPNTEGLRSDVISRDGKVVAFLGNDTFLSTDLRSIGIAWERIDDDIIGDYYLQIGSKEGLDDVLPNIMTEYNMSGAVWIGEPFLYLSSVPSYNISDLKYFNDECAERLCDDVVKTDNRFHMEPGRTLFSQVVVCTVGHHCDVGKILKTTFLRQGDVIANASVTVVELEDGKGDVVVRLVIGSEMEEDQVLLAGILEEGDLQEEYTSDASFTFSPVIVDPDATINQTNRFLDNRIIEMLGPAFYTAMVARAPLTDPLSMSVSYKSYANCSERPRLLFWDPDTKAWHDASHSCEDTMDVYYYDEDKCTLTVKVCSTDIDTSENEGRMKRNAGTGMFAGPNLFIPAMVSEDFVNCAPVVTSLTSFLMEEDAGTLVYTLTAEDPDGDEVCFRLDEGSLDSTRGNITVLPNGQLIYRPCLDCYGTDEAQIIVKERRNDPAQPIAVQETLTFHVAFVNDNPELFFAVDGYNILGDDTYVVTVTIEERNADNVAYGDFVAQVGGYDVDTDDSLTLVYDTNYPIHGQLELDEQLQDFTFVSLNCSGDQDGITAESTTSIKSSGSTQIPFPCDLYPPHDTDRLAWVVSRMRYIPQENFYGVDTLQVNLVDSAGGLSRVLLVNIHVLENRCVNNGTCAGPDHDLDCTSERRSEGFEEYGCVCLSGFEGVYCELEIDECYSNPCPSNYTCMDQVDGYACYCANPNWPCGHSINEWAIFILVVLITLSILLLVLLALYYLKRKNDPEKKVEESGKETKAWWFALPFFGRHINKIHPDETPDNSVVSPINDGNVSNQSDAVEPVEMTTVAAASGLAAVETSDDLENLGGERPQSSAGRSITVSPAPTSNPELVDCNPGEELPVNSMEESGTSHSRPVSRTATPSGIHCVTYDGDGIETTQIVEQRFGFVSNPRNAKLAWNIVPGGAESSV